MNDGAGDSAAPAAVPAAATAGRLLREAREKQGLHIAALAAAIKVAPKKLELLESDRFDELPDATFTRALAQTVCRALKTDPAPVMRLLPPPAGHRLEQVGGGLNAPFRERPGLLVQRDWMQLAGNPVSWLVAVIVVATIAIYFLPASVTSLAMGRAAASAPPARGTVEPGMPPEPADGNASAPSVVGAAIAASESAPPPVGGRSATPATPSIGSTETATADAGPAGLHAASAAATSVPAVAVGASAARPSALAGLPPGMLQLQARAASWIEVTDGRGKSLVSRLVQPGEAIGVDGVPPLKLRIGNAAGTQVLFRGQPTELQSFTRDNVARLELK